MNRILSHILIGLLTLYPFFISKAQNAEPINFQFEVSNQLELVSLTINRPTNKIKLPLQIAIQLRDKHKVYDEYIFDYSISSIWRISPTEFFVLLGPQDLHRIQIDEKKIKHLGNETISKDGKLAYGTNVTNNIIFKIGDLLLAYEDYDRNFFQLIMENKQQRKTLKIGKHYNSTPTKPSFIYPPHASLQVHDGKIYVLDEKLKNVHIITTDLKSITTIKLNTLSTIYWNTSFHDLTFYDADNKVNIPYHKIAGN